MSKEVEIRKQREALAGQIASVYCDFQGLLNKIADAKEEKVSAKERYGACFNRGDESGMRDSLKIIRESNSKVEALGQELKGFPEKEDSLRKLVGQIIAEARANKLPVEKSLKAAQANLKEAESVISQCHSLLNEVNNLNKFILDETRLLRKGEEEA